MLSSDRKTDAFSISRKDFMGIFDEVKKHVTVRAAMEQAGIVFNRSNMCKCPFHQDKTASMKVKPNDKKYFCFGCGEKGDAIDFVSKYYGLSLKDAAMKICQDFGLDYRPGRPYKAHRSSGNKSNGRIRAKPAKSPEQLFMESCDHCYRVLCYYLHLLEQWKIEYAPRADQNEDWHPLFVEACQKIVYVNYLLDILWDGTIEEKAAFLKDMGRKVKELEERISKINRRTGTYCEDSGKAA